MSSNLLKQIAFLLTISLALNHFLNHEIQDVSAQSILSKDIISNISSTSTNELDQDDWVDNDQQELAPEITPVQSPSQVPVPTGGLSLDDSGIPITDPELIIKDPNDTETEQSKDIPTMAPTVSVSPTLIPTQTSTPIPQPTKAPNNSMPNTLRVMVKYDYVGKSVTGLSKTKVPVATLQKQVKAYGTLYGTGMPYKEYQSAMNYQWIDATEYNKKPTKLNIDLNKSMNYSTYVKTLKMLSRYDGVYLYKIGKSTQGRDIYAIEIDVTSNINKTVYMFTGQIHAREFAGGTFLVKQFTDLIQKAQTDKKTLELLKSNKFVAVPIVNVDGREALIMEARNFTTISGQLWKAYTNGTDGNRNFPGLQWGQVAKGNQRMALIAKQPGYANYPGSYAGSNIETKALMKWIYHYVVVEQAKYYLDMHQQGSVIYAGKGWQTRTHENKSLTLRTNVLNVLNKGTTRRKYVRVLNETNYGLRGEGTSLTDYAISLAVGAKFSPAYGFMAFTDGKKEYILMQIKDLDLSKIKVKEVNKDLAAITLEIGYGINYLGDSLYTRKLLASEYTNYKFNELLEALPRMK